MSSMLPAASEDSPFRTTLAGNTWEALSTRSEGEDTLAPYESEVELTPVEARYLAGVLEGSEADDVGTRYEWSTERRDDIEPDPSFESSAKPVSARSAQALGGRQWQQALKFAIEEGVRDINRLTNMVFFARHRDLGGRALTSQTKDSELVKEWVAIRAREVWPAVIKASANAELNVSGELVAARDRLFWGRPGQRFKRLVLWAARLVDLDPGLLAANLLAEESRYKNYFSTRPVDSYEDVSVDNFYVERNKLERRVPAYRLIAWDKSQRPRIHYNDAKDSPTLVASVYLNSGRDGLLANAVFLKYCQLRLRDFARERGKDFDALPVATRYALLRIAFNGGRGTARTLLLDVLNGRDLLVGSNQKLAKYATVRNATIHAAEALHLAEWVFGQPAPAILRKEAPGTKELDAEEFYSAAIVSDDSEPEALNSAGVDFETFDSGMVSELAFGAHNSEMFDSETLDAASQREASDPEAFDLEAFDLEAFDLEAFDPEAFDPEAFDPEAFDSDAFDPDAFDPDAPRARASNAESPGLMRASPPYVSARAGVAPAATPIPDLAKWMQDVAALKLNLVRAAESEKARWAGRPESDASVLTYLEEYHREVVGAGAADWAKRYARGQRAWSGVFISFVVTKALQKSGMPVRLFNKSATHAKYLAAAKRNRTMKNFANPFWLYRLTEAQPEPGDLLCKNRTDNDNVTFDNLTSDLRSHVDIVVSRLGNQLVTIGGNVGRDTVAEKRVALTSGFVTDATNTRRQGKYFALLRVRQNPLEGFFL